MKKTLVAAALAGMLVAVAACGGSSATVGSTPTFESSATVGSTPTVVPSATVQSNASGGSAATSADRAKFVGTWTGHYGCDVKSTIADKMIIKAGSGDLDLSINIHVGFANPDTVTGTLTSPTEVDVPEQSMGGAAGTAKLKLTGDTLEFRATGLGVTCGGADYTRVP